MEELNKLSEQILKHAFKVHTEPGPGVLESSYKECLYYLLNRNGIYAEKEKALPLLFEEIRMDIGYRVDLLVDNKIIIEIKAIESFYSCLYRAGTHISEIIWLQAGLIAKLSYGSFKRRHKAFNALKMV